MKSATNETVRESESIDRDEVIRFFSVLSHDLKSPIFSIDGFSELLLSEYEDKLDEDGVDFLRRIRSSAQQMKRVLDSMSRMLKLLARPNAPRPIELGELLEELRLKFSYQLEEEGIDLVIDESLPTVTADREKLMEVLAELLTNALTFSEKAKGERFVRISAEDAGEDVRIVVTDDGIGVDPRYVEQVFELGLKLDKSKGEGPGYGLFVAKRVMESHGGSIGVESVSEGGSRFWITLPRAT